MNRIKNTENSVEQLLKLARVGVPVTITFTGSEFIFFLSKLGIKNEFIVTQVEASAADDVELVIGHFRRSEASANMSERVFNIIAYHGFKTIGDLRRYGRTRFGNIRGCGKAVMKELDEFLLSYGVNW